MTILEEILFALFIGAFIYVWNRFIIPRFVQEVVRMNNNAWLNKNEATIIKCYQVFFWAALILYVLSRIFFTIIGAT
jgi:hypothetical protein